jgi:hypothetical protein
MQLTNFTKLPPFGTAADDEEPVVVVSPRLATDGAFVPAPHPAASATTAERATTGTNLIPVSKAAISNAPLKPT